jgi:hypothetical protein
MPLRLGIDIACRAAHQVSLADEQGRFIWTGRRFHTIPQDLDRLWNMLPNGTDPAQVLVVMEPSGTRSRGGLPRGSSRAVGRCRWRFGSPDR